MQSKGRAKTLEIDLPRINGQFTNRAMKITVLDHVLFQANFMENVSAKENLSEANPVDTNDALGRVSVDGAWFSKTDSGQILQHVVLSKLVPDFQKVHVDFDQEEHRNVERDFEAETVEEVLEKVGNCFGL